MSPRRNEERDEHHGNAGALSPWQLSMEWRTLVGLEPNQFGLVRPARLLMGHNRLCSDCDCPAVAVVAAMVVHVRAWAVPHVPLVPPRVDRGPKRCRLCSSSGCSVFAGSKRRIKAEEDVRSSSTLPVCFPLFAAVLLCDSGGRSRFLPPPFCKGQRAWTFAPPPSDL